MYEEVVEGVERVRRRRAKRTLKRTLRRNLNRNTYSDTLKRPALSGWRSTDVDMGQ